MSKWKSLASQGQGIQEFFGDKIGNTWVYKPELLKPSRYLNVLKLRTNAYCTRTAFRRVKKDTNINCGIQAETLRYILGLCINTKSKKMKRHDEICDLIANNVSKEYAIFREPEIKINGERRKPNMVIKDHEKVYVDVTVRKTTTPWWKHIRKSARNTKRRRRC